MLCPICQFPDHRVQRTFQRDKDIVRVRVCERCRYRFTTFETAEEEVQRLRRLEAAAKEWSEEFLQS